MGLVREVITQGGTLHPLLGEGIHTTQFPSLMNPSILIDKNNILCNIRNTNYILYHSEYTKEYASIWGPLSYIHPEDDRTLRTQNIICSLDSNLVISKHCLIDTTRHDVPPNWDFVGLEDGRLIKWEGSYYISGVRRDIKPDGEGRMELCEIKSQDGKWVEVSRYRIHPPEETYCEKNWMPILDMPFHYVRWANPLQILKVNIPDITVHKGDITSEYVIQKLQVDEIFYRGGSQVVRLGNYRICITHEVDLHYTDVGKKNGIYLHRFLIWDRNWDLIWKSEPFNFMDTEIEFCCGLAVSNKNLLISFGVQDNCSYVLSMPISILEMWSKCLLSGIKTRKVDE